MTGVTAHNLPELLSRILHHRRGRRELARAGNLILGRATMDEDLNNWIVGILAGDYDDEDVENVLAAARAIRLEMDTP